MLARRRAADFCTEIYIIHAFKILYTCPCYAGANFCCPGVIVFPGPQGFYGKTLYPIQWKPPAELVLLFRAQLSPTKPYEALFKPY